MTARHGAHDRNEQAGPRLPGEGGLWLFIIGDLIFFALMFAGFAATRAYHPQMVVAGQQTLSPLLALASTIMLLTGSWLVVLATIRRDEWSALPLGWGSLAGAGFLVIKSLEYRALFDNGHSLIDNDFYSWYFVLTGYHALHVLVGMLTLYMLGRQMQRNAGNVDRRIIESVACYWHLVVVLWIGIFSLVYLA